VPVEPPTALAPAPREERPTTYVVKKGDSLWKIAKVQGTTIAALKAANNLTSDSLKVGQKLTIPAKVAPATTVSAPVTTPAGATTAPATTTPAVSGPAVIAPGISVR
jgi:LysM repeat protein